MSETTAFLAGTAVAGVSALLLLKGGLGVGDAMVPSYNPGVAAPPSLSTVSPAGTQDGWSQSDGSDQLRNKVDQQNTLTAQLRTQLDSQEKLTQDLQDQLERQRNEFDRVAARLEDQRRDMDRLTLQQGLPDAGSGGALAVPPQKNNGTAIAIWVMGGLFVVIAAGGGAILLTVILLSGQQQSRRQSRPAQQHYILHSEPGNPPPYAPPFPPRYPSQSAQQRPSQSGPTYTLPPRNVRRIDNDYY